MKTSIMTKYLQACHELENVHKYKWENIRHMESALIGKWTEKHGDMPSRDIMEGMRKQAEGDYIILFHMLSERVREYHDRLYGGNEE